MRGVDRVLTDELGDVNSPYDVGDDVWVKPPGSRCNTVEVDGMPRHVRDLRSAVLREANPDVTGVTASDTSRRRVRETTEG